MTRVIVARDAALTDVIALTEGIVALNADQFPDGPFIRLSDTPGTVEIASLRRCPDGQVALDHALLRPISQRYLSVCTNAPNMNGNADFSFDYSTSFNASTLPPSLVRGGFHAWFSVPVTGLANTTNRLRMMPAVLTALGFTWKSDSTSHYQLSNGGETDGGETDTIITIAGDNPTVTVTFCIPPAALQLERGNLFVPPSTTSGATNFPNVLSITSALLAALLLSQMLLV
ncbi:hypothetical protein FOA52_000238 [Chlamydomonas sp. UWO 241]|nr:hypothetical protein FOA52_000238 [Chlamydomonas sp. UWO 241]